MTETVILIRDDQKPISRTVSSISELAQQLLSDQSIVGVLFYDRLHEDGPPPAPKDKGGD